MSLRKLSRDPELTAQQRLLACKMLFHLTKLRVSAVSASEVAAATKEANDVLTGFSLADLLPTTEDLDEE